MPARGPLNICLLMVAWGSIVASVSAITIQVRQYCEITGGCAAGDFFVDHPAALDALKFAVKAFEPFTDSLSAIPSNPGWTATFTNPETGQSGATVANLSIPTNTLLLYAGGYDMPVNQVGEAGPGTATISLSRGQGIISGSGADDFATWGGSIAFDTMNGSSPRNWHFGIDTPPAPGQVDFLTIAFHELGHLFGFGLAPSFDNLVAATKFHGASVMNLTGTPQDLATDTNHWASGATSPPYESELPAALTSSLLLGRRTPLTPLDYASLKDMGWQVPDKLLGLHGDADDDGDVDGRDFLAWQRAFGSTGPSAGDFNGDQKVDGFDLWLWRNNHGREAALGSLSILQVPEPDFVAVFWSLLVTALPRRRPGRVLREC